LGGQSPSLACRRGRTWNLRRRHLLANELSPMTTLWAAAARATATSPSGWTAWTPVGEMSTGIAVGCPRTVVERSLFVESPATCGAKQSSSKAATLPAIVRPAPIRQPVLRRPTEAADASPGAGPRPLSQTIRWPSVPTYSSCRACQCRTARTGRFERAVV
jgi:hypothetical protein